MQKFIKADTKDMARDRTEMQSEIEKIHKEVDELAEELALLANAWEGPAWETYQMQIAEDVEHIHGICDSLQHFLAHMTYAQQEYEKCEMEIKRLIDSIPI